MHRITLHEQRCRSCRSCPDHLLLKRTTSIGYVAQRVCIADRVVLHPRPLSMTPLIETTINPNFFLPSLRSGEKGVHKIGVRERRVGQRENEMQRTLVKGRTKASHVERKGSGR